MQVVGVASKIWWHFYVEGNYSKDEIILELDWGQGLNNPKMFFFSYDKNWGLIIPNSGNYKNSSRRQKTIYCCLNNIIRASQKGDKKKTMVISISI